MCIIYISDPHKFRMQVPKLKCQSRNDAVSFKHCDAFNLQKQGNQPKLQQKKTVSKVSQPHQLSVIEDSYRMSVNIHIIWEFNGIPTSPTQPSPSITIIYKKKITNLKGSTHKDSYPNPFPVMSQWGRGGVVMKFYHTNTFQKNAAPNSQKIHQTPKSRRKKYQTYSNIIPESGPNWCHGFPWLCGSHPKALAMDAREVSCPAGRAWYRRPENPRFHCFPREMIYKCWVFHIIPHLCQFTGG